MFSGAKMSIEILDIEKYPYRQALGQVLYLANMSRPDISNSVRELGKVASGPTLRHWKSLQHLLRYIVGPVEYSLFYPRQTLKSNVLLGYCDADFAGDTTISRKSCSGYAMKLGRAIIAWASRTQKMISTSTTDAEWTALYEGMRHGEHIPGFLNELGLDIKNAEWRCDNEAIVIAITTPGHTGCTRHLDVKLKKTREMVMNNLIKVRYVPSSEQEADGFTKRLSKAAHEGFRDFLLTK